MTSVNKIISIAKKEVGYLEKKSNASLDSKTVNAGNKNFTKYARDLDKINFYNGKKNGFPWCDVFVDWCMVQAFGVDSALNITNQFKGSSGAGCIYSMGYYIKDNSFYKEPKKGDQIFFSKDKGKTSYHTGLVVKVDKSKVYTIEGNTSSKAGVVENGGSVEEKSYNLGYSKIAGYGRPAYSKIELEKNGDDEVSEKIKIVANGEDKEVSRILKDNTNYISIRDLDAIGVIAVKWDDKNKKVIICSK